MPGATGVAVLAARANFASSTKNIREQNRKIAKPICFEVLAPASAFTLQLHYR